jgi:hypothetical protein
MSEQRKKKSYVAFLIDRPSNGSQLHQGNQGAIITLMNCLRHRLVLTAGSKKSEHQNIESGADGGGSIGFLLAKYQNSSSAAAKKTSVYDTLLQLIDEFDATGAAEIFRLLLERRTAIPLFVPDSRKHHLNLFRHITIPGVNTRLGEDQSLFRVAVISCCQRNVSQTTEIMNSVFNVQSVHRQDLSTGSLSSNPLIAEIGVGCLVIEATSKTAKKVQHVLVIHVIGEFRPLWKCLQHFVSYLLVEDSTIEEERFCHMFPKDEETTSTKHPATALGLDAFNFSCVWTPSMGEMSHEFAVSGNGFRLRVEGQLRGETLSLFKDTVSAASEMAIQSNCTTSQELKMLHEIPVLIEESYSPLECVSPSEIKLSDIQSVRNLGDVKKFEFLLQKYYLKRAKIEEAKVEHRLNNEMVAQFEDEIRKVKETIRSQTVRVQNHPLLKVFLQILEKEDSCSRVLSFGLLENELAKRGEQELGPLLKKVQELSTLYAESLSNAVRETGIVSKLKNDLNSAKTELIDSALNVEHLWRELSHLYTDMEPEKRSPSIQKIPRLAAQHLLDGFPLELLDGDSNMIRQDWIKVVLYELGKLVERKRMFVLSVMGVQSSGKSTMLNTMFGIRMRTSVGQCTRGVNMQLLAVEGRPEYDYILLLDTEGTRAPEYHGLPGNEKRDNRMATLSILLSDATIIVIPGENDAAVKEILPIVLMAYEGSKLAEDNGGRLSSRMFFLYNRIDTSQANKLDNIIQTLGTSLHTAFNQVQKLTGNLTNLRSESPFGNFNLDSSSSTSDRDVCILGNVKSKSEPPGDVPDEAYGEALIKFREHIHQRVVSNVEGKAWESSTVDKFSAYIKEVWSCICSANFNLNFATVVERMTFDQLDIEYKLKEQELSEAYMKFFTNIKKEMRKINERRSVASATCLNSMTIVDTSNNNNEDFSVLFISNLNDAMSPTLRRLEDEVNVIVKAEGREKWSVQFLQMWELNKKKQEEVWTNNIKKAFNRICLYEERLKSYERKMRQEINDFFKSTSSEFTDAEMKKLAEKFQKVFDKMLLEIKQEFPPKNIDVDIAIVYKNSHVIKGRQIGTNWTRNDSAFAFLMCLREEQKRGGNGAEALPGLEIARKQALLLLCVEYVTKYVQIFVDSKLCYDDSIVYTVIKEVDKCICKNQVCDHSVIEQVHAYGRKLISELLGKIQDQWEANNSVYAKFKSSEEIMRNYFDLVSKGAAKTKLFASTMANTLSNVLFSGIIHCYY